MIKVDELFQTQIKQTFPRSKQLSSVGKALALRDTPQVLAPSYLSLFIITINLVLLYLTTVPRTTKLFDFAILFLY